MKKNSLLPLFALLPLVALAGGHAYLMTIERVFEHGDEYLDLPDFYFTLVAGFVVIEENGVYLFDTKDLQADSKRKIELLVGEKTKVKLSDDTDLQIDEMRKWDELTPCFVWGKLLKDKNSKKFMIRPKLIRVTDESDIQWPYTKTSEQAD